MLEKVLQILDKSKEEDVDILVARDKLIAVAEDSGAVDRLHKAYELIHDYYKTITKCRRLGDNETIGKLVAAVEKEDRKEIESIKQEVSLRKENE